jgi:hypothetical protein
MPSARMQSLPGFAVQVRLPVQKPSPTRAARSAHPGCERLQASSLTAVYWNCHWAP